MLLLKNLTYFRNSKIILDKINVKLNKGEALIIRGSNGSGKTTLLNIINGDLFPASGILSIENLNDKVNGICYFNEYMQIDLDTTVHNNLFFWINYFGHNYNLNTVSEQLNLSHLLNFEVKNLSMGQKKRVALGRLLVSGCPIWLLDEPTLGLDINSIFLLENLLIQHLNNGGLAIIATHQVINIPNSRTLLL